MRIFIRVIFATLLLVPAVGYADEHMERERHIVIKAGDSIDPEMIEEMMMRAEAAGGDGEVHVIKKKHHGMMKHQKMSREVANCVLKHLGKVESDSAAHLLHMACEALQE